MTIWDFAYKGYDNQLYIVVLVVIITFCLKLVINEFFRDD